MLCASRRSSRRDGLLSHAQGFQRVADNLEDTCLDNPRAGDEYPAIVSAAQKHGWLEPSFEVRLADGLLSQDCDAVRLN